MNALMNVNSESSPEMLLQQFLKDCHCTERDDRYGRRSILRLRISQANKTHRTSDGPHSRKLQYRLHILLPGAPGTDCDSGKIPNVLCSKKFGTGSNLDDRGG